MADSIECICDRDDCRACWLRTMDDTAEIVVVPVVSEPPKKLTKERLQELAAKYPPSQEWYDRSEDLVPIVHDAVIDPADVPLIVPTPHGYQEPCS